MKRLKSASRLGEKKTDNKNEKPPRLSRRDVFMDDNGQLGRMPYYIRGFAKKFIEARISKILQKLNTEPTYIVPVRRFYVIAGFYGFTKQEARALVLILHRENAIIFNGQNVRLVSITKECAHSHEQNAAVEVIANA